MTERVITALDDFAVTEAVRGLRPPLGHRDSIGVVRFAPSELTYKVDRNGGGTRVYLYGTDEHGHDVCVRASGFYPYLYVELTGFDARQLVDELAATIVASLALDSKQWAPERQSALASMIGTITRKGNRVYRMLASSDVRAMPVVGYEVVPATIMRGYGGEYGYRGIAPRQMLKIYFNSPAMLVRARTLMHGKNAHLTPLEQAKELSQSRYSRQDVIIGKTQPSMLMDYIKDVSEAEVADAAADAFEHMPTEAAMELEEFDAEADAMDIDVGSQWDNDEVELLPGATAVADSYEALKAAMEVEFVAKALKRLETRKSTGILSRLREERPLMVCDADIDFVLRFCIDAGISPNAWVQVNLNAPPLGPNSCRLPRTGLFSADGKHADYPDATWLLESAPPGIAPHECRVTRPCSVGPSYGDGKAETYAQIELRCDFHHLSAVKDESMQATIAQHVRISFDCEMETGPNNAFPQPSDQRVIKVGIAIPYAKHVQTHKKWRLIVFGLGASLKHPERADADVFNLCYGDERLMLRAFYRFLALLRPDEVVSFNGHGFDLRYLEARSTVLGIHDEFANSWSKYRTRSPIAIRPRVFESTAHGRHEMFEAMAEGVLFVDIYLLVTRNPGIRLPSYSLDKLSEVYLKDHKEKVSPADINGLQETEKGRLDLTIYVLKDAMLPVRLDNDQRWMLGHKEKARLTGCTLGMLLNRGMSIQGKSLVYRWSRRGLRIPAAAANIGIPDAGKYRLCVNYTRTEIDRRVEGKYEGAIVLDPDIGLYVRPVATLDFNSLYPSEQISLNMDVATLIADGFDMRRDAYLAYLVQVGAYTWDTLTIPVRTMISERPFCIGVEPGATRFITHGALAGLLPDIQRFNLTSRKKVRQQLAPLEELLKAAKDVKKPSAELVKQFGVEAQAAADAEFDRVFAAVQKAGVAIECSGEPAVLIEYLGALVDVLEQRQLGYKLVANSMYGLGGSAKSFQYTPKIAAAVTASGRCHIYFAKAHIEGLLDLRLDDALVQRMLQFPGVKSLLVKLPSGKDAIATMFAVIRKVRESAQARPHALRTSSGVATVTPTRSTKSLSDYFGAVRRSRSGINQSGELVSDESSRGPAEIDADVRIKVVYGDSVLGDTPLVIRQHGRVRTVRIDEIAGEWLPYGDKEQLVGNFEVWQDGGFTRVRRVIRHGCDKAIWRVVTPTGMVDCTSDHSLLSVGGARIRPIDVVVGCSLLHERDDAAMLDALYVGKYPTPDEAFSMGLVAGDRTGATFEPTALYASLYNEHGERRVPAEILGAPIGIVTAFWLGFFGGERISDSVRGKELATGIWLLGRRLGLNLYIVGIGKSNDFRLWTGTPVGARAITSLKILSWDGVENTVYDLETVSHHFHVGPGNLIVHNTDSIFPAFWNGIELQLVAEFCIAAADFISIAMHIVFGTGSVDDSVYRIEFEKLAAAMLLAGKKKYAMLKYVLNRFGLLEPKPAEGVPSLSGMEAGKRDTTPFVARGQRVCISILLDRRHSPAENMRRAVAFIFRELVKPLLENRVDPYLLVQTKQLRNYIEAYTAHGKPAPVHVQLAALLTRRAGGRDKPDAPRPGDRLPFVIRRGDPREPVSARGENPTYALQHGVPIDAEYYLNYHVGPCLGRILEPLLTAHRVDLKSDKEREDETRLFMFGSRTGFCPPPDADRYDFSEYRDKTAFHTTVVRYPPRRRIDIGTATVLREVRIGANCAGCGHFLLDRRPGAVCHACMVADRARHEPSLLASFARLSGDEHHLSVERAAIVKKCQTCAGCATQYKQITCEEWECPVMWVRKANEQAVVENAARAVDIAKSLEW